MSWEIPAFADYSSNFLCIFQLDREGSQANKLSVKTNHYIFQLTLEKHSLVVMISGDLGLLDIRMRKNYSPKLIKLSCSHFNVIRQNIHSIVLSSKFIV